MIFDLKLKINNNLKQINMKTIKFLIVLLLFTGVFIFTSCDEDDPAPIVNTHEDAYVDVLLKKVMTPDGIRYKEVFFAGGIDIDATGSKVTTPDGTVYDLVEFWAGAGKLNSMAGAMMVEQPAAGDYTFTLKFSDDYEKSLDDTLEDVEIGLPMSLVITYTPGDTSMTVSWTAVANADLLCVKITEIDPATGMPLDAAPYFKKAQLPADATSLTINIDGAEGWMRPTSELVTGTQYFVSVVAKKVEAGTEISGASQNFQTSSCVKTMITY